MSNHPVSPPPIPEGSPPAAGVRRVHTISASSRPSRIASRLMPSEVDQQQQIWNDDEVVDQEWVGGVGAVGEKNAGLHRQSSLPTRYNKAFPRTSQNRQAGTLTPRTINSLTAITAEHGPEGEEEEWENDMRGWNGDERLDARDMPSQQQQYAHVVDSQSGSSHGHSPLSPSFPPQTTSPPPAEVNVRRNQSLTYGAAGGNMRRTAVNLRRSGTLQAQMERPHAASNTSPPSPVDNEEDFNDEDRFNTEEYQYALLQQQQQQQNALKQASGHYTPTNDVGRNSPWSMNANANSNWVYGPGLSAGSTTDSQSSIDEVQRALSSLELSSPGLVQGQTFNGNGAQGFLPPRLNQQGGTIGQGTSIRRPEVGANGLNDVNIGLNQRAGGKLQLNTTDIDVGIKSGPSSASTNVPTIGHGFGQRRGSNASGWGDTEKRSLSTRSSNSNLQYSARGYDASNLPPNPPIPAHYLNQQDSSAQAGGRVGSPFTPNQQGSLALGVQQQQHFISPIDVPSLISAKGYNPSSFDCRPPFARYFVIKSYTEDDVHKSLKYEIWSSTDPGNKRLDKAFKDTGNRGPIYLFFSVNASGHFCGVAEMMTAVDYTRSSTVWASDKWKGVFKVRWIFVRDIPNANLRHIKLNNTQERKPVTNSRDTQELLPDAGQEMLRIFFTHPAKTSLLQDFAFYELQSMQKLQQQQTSPGSPPLHPTSPQPQQHPFAMPNPYSQGLAGLPGQIMPAQMNSQFAIQSNIMRNPSPVPVNAGNQGYAGNF